MEKMGREGGSTLYPCLGDRSASPFTLRAKGVLRGGWPPDITNGAWFAGDEPFGGALIVPTCGDMLLLTPRD
ncbi:hypothetical protein ABZ930_30220 [Streptomyces sp. NPDC046716]|uniref:hypothetical protein n=1 Tax=Streptomyces sp. NPDC046716 TaxID=3157093 RepID=UPI003403F58E